MTALPQAALDALRAPEAPAFRVADNDNVPNRPNGRIRRFGDRHLEVHDYLIKGMLPKIGTCFLGGQSSAGKTFVGIDVGLSLILGRSFLGRNVRKGSVLWFAAEGSGILEHRIEAARRGKFRCATSDLSSFLFEEAAPNKDTAEALANLEGAIKSAKTYCEEHTPNMPLRLVVIDTLAAYFGIVDENGNAEAGAFMTRLNALARKWGVLIMLVHHVGKAAESGLRGASAYYAGADAAVMVLADINLQTGAVNGSRTIALGKNRDGAPGPLASFAISEAVIGKDIDGDDKPVGYVEFVELEASEGKGKAMTRPVRDLIDSIDESLIDHGENRQVFPDSPPRKCVNIKHVQAMFNQRHTVGESGDPHEARRSAYRRAYKKLFENKGGSFASTVVGLDEYIWRA